MPPKGTKMSEEQKVKIALAHIGRKRPPFSQEWRENLSNARKGKKFSKQHKFNLGISKKEWRNPQWKGGKKQNEGYVLIKCHEHPYKNISNYVFEHRIVMEKHLGRYLTVEEVVHHINGIKNDNRIENLMLFPNDSAHHCFHQNIRRENKFKNAL